MVVGLSLLRRYLRGRMAPSFLASLNLPELLASSEDEYVHLAVTLGKDPQWRQRLSDKIAKRVHLLWNRDEVVLEWALFLLHAVRLVRTPCIPKPASYRRSHCQG